MAVRPIGAQTIATDTKGLTAGEVKIPTSDGQIPAYRACPVSGRNFPIALVVQEIFGVHEHIKDMCRRLAKSGYCAVAPEMFARQGDVSKIENVQEIITKVVSKVPDAQVMSDLDAAALWATKNSRGNANRLAITGFCWGGRIVWLYASHNPQLKAGAAWYGRIEGDKNALTPRNPIDLAGALKAPSSASTGGRTPAFRRIRWKRCVPRCALWTIPRRSMCIRKPSTASTRIIAPATTKRRPRMRIRKCWRGSRNLEHSCPWII